MRTSAVCHALAALSRRLPTLPTIGAAKACLAPRMVSRPWMVQERRHVREGPRKHGTRAVGAGEDQRPHRTAGRRSPDGRGKCGAGALFASYNGPMSRAARRNVLLV